MSRSKLGFGLILLALTLGSREARARSVPSDRHVQHVDVERRVHSDAGPMPPGYEDLACKGVNDDCFWDGTPLYCNCGHPLYDSFQRAAGAVKFAERIIKSGLDVIALNEMWDDEVVELVTEQLKGTYPFLRQAHQA